MSVGKIALLTESSLNVCFPREKNNPQQSQLSSFGGGPPLKLQYPMLAIALVFLFVHSTTGLVSGSFAYRTQNSPCGGLGITLTLCKT